MPPARPTRRFRAVVFDLDDTLFRERDYVRGGYAAVAAALRKRGQEPFPPSPEGGMVIRRCLPVTMLAGSGSEHGHPRTTRDDHATPPDPIFSWMWRRFLAGKREKMFDALSAHFGLGLSDRDIAALVQVYRSHRPTIRPCRGVPELLAALRRRGLRLGLLTDGWQGQRLKLDALGLGGYFHAVVVGSELRPPAWKPSPRGYELIRRRLGVPHPACAYVADNPAKDFLAPNALGWLTVRWVRPGQLHAATPAPPPGQPQRTIRSGPQLLRILQEKKGSGPSSVLR